ncbi:MAG: gliding motility-associated C-terminal domain-containing protein [Flavobacteriales bacterium]
MKKLISSTLILSFAVTAQAGNEHDHDHGNNATVTANVHQTFVQNLGQWSDKVLYRTGVNGAMMFVERNSWTWSKLEESAADRMHDIALLSNEEQNSLVFNGHAWRMRFVDGNSDRTTGTDKADHYENYFIGNDRSNWKGHVPVFGGLVQHDVWPGIDVVLSKVNGNFKYDVVLEPGADHMSVALAYDGLDAMNIGEKGELVLTTSVGEVTELAPVAFYGDEKGGAIPCSFILDGNTVKFKFDQAVDASRTIVIDPVLIAGTYSGATGASNYGHCATFDNAGNIFTAGRNFGPTYPATVGAFQTAMGGGGTDISLSKYSPDGSMLIWASYLGGSGGENPHSLVTNALGELIVLGSSGSSDFPVTPGAFDNSNADLDITVTHISFDGSVLEGSTFVGGSGSDGYNEMWGNYGEGYRGEVIVDQVGNIVISSVTSSADFPASVGAFQPTLAGGQDGVVFVMDPTCSQMLAATFVGGSSDDNAMGLRIAANGEIFIAGITESTDLPVSTGGYASAYVGGDRDGYVMRFSSDLTTQIAGSFFGTTSGDGAYFIDLDSADDVWIYGQTDGTIPVSPAGTYGATGQGNIFIAKLTADLTQAPITTMIPGNVAPVAFLVDVCDHIYISGYAASGALPLTADALHTTGSFYLASFDVGLTDILFGTHYGGSHVDGGTSRFDKNGIVYQGVCSGGQSMQSTPWAYAPANQIGWDIAVFKIDFETAGVQANVSSDAITGCVPATFNLTASGIAPEFIWDLGDGSPQQTGTNITVTYDSVGTYLITLIGNDPNSCNVSDTTYITLNVYDPASTLAAFEATPLSTCDGYFLQLNNTSIGANQFTWTFGDGATSTATAPTHEYAGPGTYQIGLLAVDGICISADSTTMPVTFTTPGLAFDPDSPGYLCPNGSTQISAGTGFDTYLWETGSLNSTITVSEVGTYTVTVTDGFCTATDSIDVFLATLPPPMEDIYICGADVGSLAPNYGVSNILWNTGSTEESIPVEGGNTYSFIATDLQGCAVLDTIDVFHISPIRADNFIPNVFSPNGDQKNDIFGVDGIGFQDFRMEVYDRWGLKMYETTSIHKGWNGGLDNATGSAVPDGTYFYIISFKDRCAADEFAEHHGHVTLVR